MEDVQRASNGLDLISHSNCLFLNKVQRNTIILGCRCGVGAGGEDGAGWFSHGEFFPRRMARSGAGSAPREREAMPAGCCGCGDPPANPLRLRSLALRPCGAGSRALGTGRLREPPLPRLSQGRCGISSAPALPCPAPAA